MELPTTLDALGGLMLSLALSLPRIAAAFLVLPLLTQDTVPPLVRNALFVSLALIAYPVVAAAQPSGALGAGAWPFIVAKEIFLGLALGFAFGAVFWALSAAGGIIDTQVGTNFANALDPVQGHQTSHTGSLLSMLASWLFMASGAFLVFLDLLMGSYALWPVASFVPTITPAGAGYFIGEMRYLMSAALLFAAPALVVMTLLDVSFGLVNRYAQQLNVFSMTMPLKAWAAQLLLLLSLGVVVEAVLRRLFENRALLDVLRRVLG